MLRFLCLPADNSCAITGNTIEAAPGTWLELTTSLETVRARCGNDFLIVDMRRMHRPDLGREETVRVTSVPRGAVPNLEPRTPVSEIVAAGGLLIRKGLAEPEVLLIHRKGKWDLPKGKLNRGESVRTCALREVEEEVGVRHLEVLGEAGISRYGFPDAAEYKLKTVHWFFMRTSDTDFVPEEREGITAVGWYPWSEAVRHIGYLSFRELILDTRERAAALTAAEVAE